jgi:hypothetical protein
MPKRGYGEAANRNATKKAAPVQSIRTAPIRVTLDLRPQVHRKLKRWCNGAAVELELSRVDLAPVLRILADQLLDDEKLAERVMQALSEDAGKL